MTKPFSPPHLDFYGEGKSYHCFVGRDATRALAKMSLKEEDLVDPRTDDLTDQQKETLTSWQTKFRSKYAKVGILTSPKL